MGNLPRYFSQLPWGNPCLLPHIQFIARRQAFEPINYQGRLPTLRANIHAYNPIDVVMILSCRLFPINFDSSTVTRSLTLLLYVYLNLFFFITGWLMMSSIRSVCSAGQVLQIKGSKVCTNAKYISKFLSQSMSCSRKGLVSGACPALCLKLRCFKLVLPN